MQKIIHLPQAPAAPLLLGADAAEKKLYWDRSHYDSPESQMKALGQSSTLYIGNLAFSSRVSHLQAFFSHVGPVKAIHMGLDRYQRTPCGFAFVEYAKRSHALDAVAFLSGTKLDDKVIRVELDAGFKPGRQYGRGPSGGQVRDDRRRTIDPKRSSSASKSGSMASRWQAPPTSQKPPSPIASKNEPVSGHYGPSEVQPESALGYKRSRDGDGADEPQRSAKNSRFEGSDED